MSAVAQAPRLLTLTPEIEASIRVHAAAALPGEACGLVVALADGPAYRPCRNLADGRTDAEFCLDPRDWIAAEEQGEIVAVVHSHPEGGTEISEGDRPAFEALGLPWVIVAGEEIAIHECGSGLGRDHREQARSHNPSPFTLHPSPLTEVRLHGHLAARFGRSHHYAIANAAEAVRALRANCPGFDAHLIGRNGVGYHVIVEGARDWDAIGAEELAHPVSRRATLHIVPACAGAGKSGALFKIIIGALLIWVAPYLMPVLMGLEGAALTAAAAAGGGMLGSVVGALGVSMVMGGVAQILSPSTKSEPVGDGAAPSALFNGAVNPTAQGNPVPVGYGRLIVGGQTVTAGSVALDERANDVNMRSIQYARVLDVVCEGEIEGLVAGARSIYLNDVPVVAGGGAVNHDGITWEARTGTQAQAHIPWWPAVETDITVEADLAYNDPVIRTITNPDVDRVRFTVRLDSHYATLPNAQPFPIDTFYRFEYRPSGGDWIPMRILVPRSQTLHSQIATFTTPGQAISFSVQVLWAQPERDPYNWFPRAITATVEYRKLGDPDWIALGTREQAEFQGVELGEYGATGLDMAQYEIRVSTAAGSDGTAYLASASWNEFQNHVQIGGKTFAPYQFSREVQLTGSAPWDLRVTFLTDPILNVVFANPHWESFTEIIQAKLRHPNSALMALQFDATEFGAAPTRGYDLRLLKVRVPSNYDPVKRTYTGEWDGTFKAVRAWSNNPAWCFYDLITHPRYGLGQYLDETLIDKWALYAIGRYCDALVPDGTGALEPRYTCNLYLQGREEAWRVLQNMASIFRGMLYWNAGALTAAQDAPAASVAPFTAANVVEGAFAYEGASRRARHTVVLVAWNDPADLYRRKIEYVEDAAAISEAGIVQTEIVAVGCTSRGQARRAGEWLLYTERHESELVRFRVGLEGALLYPGAVIAVADATRAGVRMGGRVKAGATATSIPLDDSVTLDHSGGRTYTLTVQLPDNTLQTRNVTSGDGAWSTLVAAAFSAAPVAGAIWLLTASDLAPTLWRVVSVAEAEPTIYEVTALAHDPGKYAYIERDIELEPRQTSLLSPDTQAAPGQIVVTESLYLAASGAVGNRVSLSWGPAPGAERYRTRALLGAIVVRQAEEVTPSVDFDGLAPGRYSFEVRAVSPFRRVSPPATITHQVLGKQARPADIEGFALEAIGDRARITWDAHPDLDVIVGGHLRIRHSPKTSGAAWNEAVDVATRVAGTLTWADVPLLTGTYLARAVDSTGHESAGTAALSTTLPRIVALNTVATVTEHSAFSGTKTDCAYDGTLGGLKISGTALAATYAFAGSVDLGAVYTSRVMIHLLAQGLDEAGTIDDWEESIDLWPDVDGAEVADCEARLWLRTTNGDPAGSPTWSAWRPFVVQDYSARAFQFRLELARPVATRNILVKELKALVDMPDRVDVATNVASGTTPLSVVYAAPFQAAPSVAITAQNMATGDYYAVTAKSATGFTIQFFNAAGAGVNRSFDWLAKGY